MTCQLSDLPTECLQEIIEHLENNISTLHSCLLVNRLWCKISVRMLWKDVWGYNYQQRSLRVTTSILSTLIACLPNESKEKLYKNEIFILSPNLKSPLFNYAEFCKVLSIGSLFGIVHNVLKKEPSDRSRLVIDEIIKMFVDQITSLKKLSYYSRFYSNFTLTYFPGVRDLSELCCSSNLPSNFFWQLSQICHNLQSISIDFHNEVSNELNELKELISLQDNLKNLTLIAFAVSWVNIIPALKKHSNTVTKLHLYSEYYDLPLSFVSLFTNLQEIIISFLDYGYIEDFKKLQFINFSKLQNLKIPYQCPKPDYMKKFLEINGKNLKKFYSGENDKTLSISIANFCPNLKNLFVLFHDGEINILKDVFINCQYLESIKIQCGRRFLFEKEVLETVANHSSNNFCELKLYNISYPNSGSVSPEDLESFIINWKNRSSKKLLCIIIIESYGGRSSLLNEENMMIIKI
ncbi:unnamed protein product [Rhizophagus irregularis]|nr:unnamed protein product [Rhizophagus irregularis]